MNAYHWGLTLVKIVFFDKHYCLQYIPYSGRSAHQKFEPDLPFLFLELLSTTQ